MNQAATQMRAWSIDRAIETIKLCPNNDLHKGLIGDEVIYLADAYRDFTSVGEGVVAEIRAWSVDRAIQTVKSANNFECYDRAVLDKVIKIATGYTEFAIKDEPKKEPSLESEADIKFDPEGAVQ